MTPSCQTCDRLRLKAVPSRVGPLDRCVLATGKPLFWMRSPVGHCGPKARYYSPKGVEAPLPVLVCHPRPVQEPGKSAAGSIFPGGVVPHPIPLDSKSLAAGERSED